MFAECVCSTINQYLVFNTHTHHLFIVFLCVSRYFCAIFYLAVLFKFSLSPHSGDCMPWMHGFYTKMVTRLWHCPDAIKTMCLLLHCYCYSRLSIVDKVRFWHDVKWQTSKINECSSSIRGLLRSF